MFDNQSRDSYRGLKMYTKARHTLRSNAFLRTEQLNFLIKAFYLIVV